MSSVKLCICFHLDNYLRCCQRTVHVHIGWHWIFGNIFETSTSIGLCEVMRFHLTRFLLLIFCQPACCPRRADHTGLNDGTITVPFGWLAPWQGIVTAGSSTVKLEGGGAITLKAVCPNSGTATLTVHGMPSTDSLPPLPPSLPTLALPVGVSTYLCWRYHTLLGG
jgi:hypothetical protein